MRFRRAADPWLSAARALRTTACAHAAVVDLHAGKRYETRGPGRTVRGVALRMLGSKAQAHVSLILDVGAVHEHGISRLVEEIHAQLLGCWAALDPGLPLDLHLDVFDLSSSEKPPPWFWLSGRKPTHGPDLR